MKILLANFTKMVDDTGGLAKVTSLFANEMNRRGHQVTLIYSDEQIGDFHYPICNQIEKYDLRQQGLKRIKFPPKLRLKREWFRLFNKEKARIINNKFAREYFMKPLQSILERVNPDIIISFQPAATKLLIVDLDVRIPIITMSHGNPEDYFRGYPIEEIRAIENCAMNQVLLPSFKEHLLSHLPNAKATVIGNAIPQYKNAVDLNIQKERYRIGFIARLTKNHKQPHLLIEAFCKIAKTYPDWELVLWGETESKIYYKQMKLMIARYGLENRIKFLGVTTDVEGALESCDIFAFPSAYEGFGLSLGEAMSKGLPVIGFKTCSAVNELILDGYNGILCEDGVAGLQVGLRILMNNRELRIIYGKNARDSMKKYSPQIIWDEWERLMERLTLEGYHG